MALPRVYRVVQDAQGNIVPQVLGSVLNHGTGVLAQLYNDAAGTQPLPNPMTSDATYGSFKFYVTPGHYDLTFSKPGYTFEPVYDFQVPDDNVTLGTMATQNASAVAITGGTINNLTSFSGTGASFLGSLTVDTFNVTTSQVNNGTTQFYGDVAMGFAFSPSAQARIHMEFLHASRAALSLRPTDADTGPAATILFMNTGGTLAGSIQQTASTVTYNTSSDARLKEAITTLVGALHVIRTLRPVSFRWQGGGEVEHGFLAHEVQAVVPEAVTGEPDAVDWAGQVVPMQMDHSKLVPWLTAALQETLAALDALTARVQALEAAPA